MFLSWHEISTFKIKTVFSWNFILESLKLIFFSICNITPNCLLWNVLFFFEKISVITQIQMKSIHINVFGYMKRIRRKFPCLFTILIILISILVTGFKTAQSFDIRLSFTAVKFQYQDNRSVDSTNGFSVKLKKKKNL